MNVVVQPFGIPCRRRYVLASSQRRSTSVDQSDEITDRCPEKAGVGGSIPSLP